MPPALKKARERLYDLSRRAGAGDLVFLSGDSHSFWVNRLADGAGRPAGIEFGRKSGTAHFFAVSTLLSRRYTAQTIRKVGFVRDGASVRFLGQGLKIW